MWAYDPASDRWTVLPAPSGQVRRVVVQGWMVWTGREVVVASAQAVMTGARARTITQAGRYDPDLARWTPIAPPPLARAVLTWAGAAVVAPFGNAVYEPGTDRWLRLPASPKPAGSPPLTAAGVERALLRTHQRATGAVQVDVLVPARPAATP